jgi:hypothetical protein
MIGFCGNCAGSIVSSGCSPLAGMGLCDIQVDRVLSNENSFQSPCGDGSLRPNTGFMTEVVIFVSVPLRGWVSATMLCNLHSCLLIMVVSVPLRGWVSATKDTILQSIKVLNRFSPLAGMGLCDTAGWVTSNGGVKFQSPCGDGSLRQLARVVRHGLIIQKVSVPLRGWVSATISSQAQDIILPSCFSPLAGMGLCDPPLRRADLALASDLKTTEVIFRPVKLSRNPETPPTWRLKSMLDKRSTEVNGIMQFSRCRGVSVECINI